MAFNKKMAFLIAALALAPAPARAEDPKSEPSPFLPCLQLAQSLGHPELLTPERDLLLKAKIAEWLKPDGKGGTRFEPQAGMFEPRTFPPHATGVGVGLIPIMVREAEPMSRRKLLPSVQLHAELLMTQLDMIAADHQSPTTKLANWIAKNYSPERETHVVLLCTTNSGRSVMAATWGRIAASFNDLERVKFHCAGNSATAINPHAIRALRGVGVDIVKTLEKAPTDVKGADNWVYTMKWAEGQTAREFSKRFTDASLPKTNFAAVIVCGELDENCPAGKAADAHFNVPYSNPALYDDTPVETAKYAERSDDIGRFMLSAMMQARAIIRRQPTPRPDAVKVANPFDLPLPGTQSREPKLKGGELVEPRPALPLPKEGGPKGSLPGGRPPG